MTLQYLINVFFSFLLSKLQSRFPLTIAIVQSYFATYKTVWYWQLLLSTCIRDHCYQKLSTTEENIKQSSTHVFRQVPLWCWHSITPACVTAYIASWTSNRAHCAGGRYSYCGGACIRNRLFEHTAPSWPSSHASFTVSRPCNRTSSTTRL